MLATLVPSVYLSITVTSTIFNNTLEWMNENLYFADLATNFQWRSYSRAFGANAPAKIVKLPL
jgi:hypothetical protein